jgi:hypothetical protein
MPDDDDEHGTFGMLMGLMLFLIVGGLLLASTVPPSAQFRTSTYDTRFR